MLLVTLMLICAVVPAQATSSGEVYYEYDLITDENGVTTARLTDFIGDLAVVVMPSNIAGYKVTEVTDSLYDSQKAIIREVTWANTVPVVPDGMFSGYTVLERVILPEGVTTIEEGSNYDFGAFSKCSSLTSVSLPNTLTYIGRYTFYKCTALTSIVIPDSVEHLGYQAFYGCSAMTTATVGTGVTTMEGSGFENCTSLTSVTLKPGLTTLGSGMFSNCAVEKLVIPSSVSNFTSSAFTGMKESLKELEICASIVPSGSFKDFTALEKVTFGEGVTTIEGSSTYDFGTFSNCSSLTSVSLPNTLTYIGRYTFYKCTALTSIVIPDSVEHLGYQAFYGCSAMTTATIGTGVTTMEGSVFADCTSLSSVTLKPGLTTLGSSMFSNCAVEKLIIPSSVSNYTSSAFTGMKESLKELEICVAVVPGGSFKGFTALEKVTLGEGVTTIVDGSTSDFGTFSSCSNLTSVSLPSTLTTLGRYAFYNCTALARICLPVNITTYGIDAIPSSATLVCPANTTTAATLTSARLAYTEPTVLDLPADLTLVEESAFLGSSAEMVIIPDGCTAIRSRAFANMPNLCYVQLPTGITVAEDAFSGSPVQFFIAP